MSKTFRAKGVAVSFAIVVAALLSLTTIVFGFCHASAEDTTSTSSVVRDCPEPTAAETSASSAIVTERTSGRVLYCKNPDCRLPNASTTKIATALTVLRHEQNLDKVVSVSAEACGVEGSSVYLRPDEKLTVRDLLYGLLLRSGNDCAVQLALTVGGSVHEFVAMMNDGVRSLGCKNTNFVTPHGLHDDNHYTTARDLAEITRAALANEDFAQIVSTKSYRVLTDGSTRVFVNKNKLLGMLDGADGVKTGYTKKAGRCFVGSATRNGMSVVAVVLNCGPMFADVAKLCEKAFAEFTLSKVIDANRICGSLTTDGVRSVFRCVKGFSYPLRKGEVCRVDFLTDNRPVADVYVDKVCVATIPLQKAD